MTASVPNQSWRHHYVPEFYLKRWCDPKKAWLLRWEDDRLLPAKQYAPKSMGYGKKLYRVEFNNQLTFDGEKHIMEGLDNRAAPLLAAWVDDHKTLTASELAILLHFFWALAARNPATQDLLGARMPEMLQLVAGEAAILGLDDRLLRMFKSENDGHKAVQLAIIEQARHQATPLSQMPCEILEFPGPLLLTSYQPLISLPSIDASSALHLVALAPHMAAAFSTETRLLEILRGSDAGRCATFINRMVAMHSDEVIAWSSPLAESMRDHIGAQKRAGNYKNMYFSAFRSLK